MNKIVCKPFNTTKTNNPKAKDPKRQKQQGATGDENGGKVRGRRKCDDHIDRLAW